MIQLYKRRNFNALINDTLTFFRQEGKNYFKAYFAINGGFLLVLMVLMFIVGKVFFQGLFNSFGTPNSNKILEEYFMSDIGFFIGTGILGGIIILIITLLSYSFPVIYLNLYEKNEKPKTGEIIKVLKANTGKIILFSLLWLVTFLPILVIITLLSVLLITLIIGIPIALVIFSGVSCWMCLSFFDYLSTNNGYFSSVRRGFSMLFQNFWTYIGASIVIYIIIYVIQSIISFIPYIIGVIGLFVDTYNIDKANPENFSFIGLMLLITFMLSIALGYIMGNFMFINQGLIYYSAKEANENQSLHSEIDLIGKDYESE